MGDYIALGLHSYTWFATHNWNFQAQIHVVAGLNGKKWHPNATRGHSMRYMFTKGGEAVIASNHQLNCYLALEERLRSVLQGHSPAWQRTYLFHLAKKEDVKGESPESALARAETLMDLAASATDDMHETTDSDPELDILYQYVGVLVAIAVILGVYLLLRCRRRRAKEVKE